MRTCSRLMALVVSCAAAASAIAGDTCPTSGRDLAACREVIIRYDPATFDWNLTPAKYGLSLLGVIRQLENRAWFVGAMDAEAVAAALAGEPGVLEAEVNRQFISPECRRWGAGVLELGPDWLRLLRSQPALRAMNAAPSGSPVQAPGEGTLVAVLDTGVSRGEPLVRKMLTERGIDTIAGTLLADDLGNGIDDDHDGETDRGWGHGTAVAALIALTAPGARILPVRVIDDECQGTAFSFAYGIVRAVDSGARVINASFGSLDEAKIIGRAVQYARDHGVAYVAPAGNQGGTELEFPARYSDSFAVAAVDALLVAPAFTAHSSGVKLVAPGVDVDVPYRAKFARVSGTSFSSALVSGALAVGFSYLPHAQGRDILRILQDTAIDVDQFNPLLRGELGKGVPDFAAATRAFAAQRRSEKLRSRTGTPGTTTLPAGTPTVLSRN